MHFVECYINYAKEKGKGGNFMRKKLNTILGVITAIALVTTSVQPIVAKADDTEAVKVVLNEVESDGDTADWAEIYNAGTTSVDISGWYLLDNDPVTHADSVVPLPEGTILEPGEFYVFEQNNHFLFGLGKIDQATIYDKEGNVVDELAWEVQATGVYARIPDGTGEFVDAPTSTKGFSNKIINPVLISEVMSNDPEGGQDWIELFNPTKNDIDVSGIVIKDNDDTHEYVIPEGTMIKPEEYLVITQEQFVFELEEGDSVRIFEDGQPIRSTTWPEGTHGTPTWGLYTGQDGAEYKDTKVATPGKENIFPGDVEKIEWPGSGEVHIWDTEPTFSTDSSGLDFYNGQLYTMDSRNAAMFVLDVNKDGTMKVAEGFEKGKRVRFRKDAEDAEALGPDAEGITLDNDGFAYIVSERDNGNKNVDDNLILKVNPKAEGEYLVALNEWSLMGTLPKVALNAGLEGIEWAANSEVEGKLWDQNTNALFDSSLYPNAVSNGVFFVALEENGHVYAYVLNKDETAVQIADIDSRLGGAMSLDYDTYTHTLWVGTDNGYASLLANISLNGTDTPDVIHVKPASGLKTSNNNEGFAIAPAEYTVNGQRPVYYFEDGVSVNALTIGSLACDYVPEETTVPKDVETTTVNAAVSTTVDKGNKTDNVTVVKPVVKSAVKKKSAAKVKITLKKVKGIKKYKVQISRTKKFKKILVKKTVKKATFTIKNKKLKKQKKLYVRVMAYRIVGKKMYHSKWSKARRVKVKN